MDSTQSDSIPGSGMVAVLDSALAAATWITASDQAAVTLARRLAGAMDVCDDVQQLVRLAAQFAAVLEQLHMTPATRLDAGEVSEAGATIIEAWNGLRAAPSGKQPAKRPAQRRPNSRPAS